MPIIGTTFETAPAAPGIIHVARSIPGATTVSSFTIGGTVGPPGSELELTVLGQRKVGFLGDSITIGGSTYSSTLIGTVEDKNSVPTYAMFAATRGSWDLVINAGISGQQSGQVLARLQSDIIDNGCDICVINSCTWNDIISGTLTVAATVANVTSMITTCLAADVIPVLCTPNPDGTATTTTARERYVQQARRRFIDLGRQYNIPVVDYFSPLVDASLATGVLQTTYAGAANDMHPGPTGYNFMGQTVATVLDRLCAGNARCDVAYAGDPDDLLAGQGFFQVDTNADGISNGWASSGASATYTRPTDAVLGTVQRITTSATASDAQLSLNLTGTITADHMYEVSGYITKSGTSQARLSINTSGSGNRRVTIDGTNPDITRGQFSIRWLPSNGVTDATVILVAGAGTGFVEFGRLGIRDLTALGIE